MENNRDINNLYSESKVNALVLINEFNNGPKILKIIYSIEDTILWESGSNRLIDSILRSPLNTFKNNTITQNKLTNKPTDNSSNRSKNPFEAENEKNIYGGSGRVIIDNQGTGKKVRPDRTKITSPEVVKSDQSGKIVFQVIINDEGNVVSAKVIQGTTITDQSVINKMLWNIKSQVKYNKEPGTHLQAQTLEIDVNSEYSNVETSNIIEDFVDEDAEFPGGISALHNFINTNLIYPEEAIKDSISGKVLVSFVIGKEGDIENVEIIKKLHPACDKEVIRMISNMPRWRPGKSNGKVVRARYRLPIDFSL